MSYCKLEAGLPRHPKVMRLCVRLGVDRPTALGYLVELWCWVQEVRPSGSLDGVSAVEIECALDWRGVEGALINALVDSGWIDRSDAGLEVHGWMERAQSWRRAQREHGARTQNPQASSDDACGTKRNISNPPKTHTRPEHGPSTARARPPTSEIKRRDQDLEDANVVATTRDSVTFLGYSQGSFQNETHASYGQHGGNGIEKTTASQDASQSILGGGALSDPPSNGDRATAVPPSAPGDAIGAQRGAVRTELVEAWSDTVDRARAAHPECLLQPVIDVSEDDVTRALAVDWRALLIEIEASSFLRGDREGWCATLRWALRPSNAKKILKGVYRDRPSAKREHASDRWAREAASIDLLEGADHGGEQTSTGADGVHRSAVASAAVAGRDTRSLGAGVRRDRLKR